MSKQTLRQLVTTSILMLMIGCSAIQQPSDQQFAAAKRVAVVSIGHDVLLQTNSKNLLLSPQHESRNIAAWQLDRLIAEQAQRHIESMGRIVVPNIKFDTEKFEQIYAWARHPTFMVDSGVWPAPMKEEIKRVAKENNFDAVVFIYAANSRSDGRIDPMGVNLWTEGMLNSTSHLWLITRVKIFDARNDAWVVNGYLSPQTTGRGHPMFPRLRVPENIAQLSFENWDAATQELVRKAVVGFIETSLPATIKSVFGPNRGP